MGIIISKEYCPGCRVTTDHQLSVFTYQKSIEPHTCIIEHSAVLFCNADKHPVGISREKSIISTKNQWRLLN